MPEITPSNEDIHLKLHPTLLALAVMGTLAGAACAQSTVTIYGKLDAGVGKAIGSKDKTVLDAAGSRLGFRGTEALGDGLKAQFAIEHRFDPQTGTANKAATFWQGFSTVGLSGGFGSINLGRQYTASYSLIQNQIDPWGGDTVAQLRDIGMKVGGLYATRVASSVRYDYSANGISFGTSVAGSNENGKAEKPWSLGLAYAAGPLYLGAGYEVTGDHVAAKANVLSLGGRYNFGVAELALAYSLGKDKANVKYPGVLVGLIAPLGAGDLKLGFTVLRKDAAGVTTTVNSKVGVGYHYKFSKRTKIYVDYGHDSKVKTESSGYDLGVQHNF